MQPTDLYFTQTIVGPPVSVVLGRRRRVVKRPIAGLEVDLGSGRSTMGDLWRDWVELSHVDAPPGLPRRRPGAARRWLERHALWIAAIGLTSLSASAGLWLFLLWRGR